MKKTLFALSLALCVLGTMGLLCHQCHKSKCLPPKGCRYGQELDICSCCNRCLKGPGEDCGGIYNSEGSCGVGLRCDKGLDGYYGDQQPGKCIRITV